MSQMYPPRGPASESFPLPPAPADRRRPPERGPQINIVLFVLTCLSMWLAGYRHIGGKDGWMYAVGLMSILGCHELGHYVAARLHHVKASLPYFIPMPIGPLGTLGAIIVTRSPFPTRREVFDVGVAGPLAGFVVAVPTWLVGLSLSTLKTPEAFDAATAQGGSLEFGDSILTWVTSHWFFPHLAGNGIVVAHPLCIAGWVGLLLTAINLLPAGSLDGGHISYAFFWRHHRRLSVATALGMVLLGSQTITFWPAHPAHLGPVPIPIDFDDPRIVWLFWALLVSVFALNHPPPLYPQVPLTRGRRWVGFATLCIFVLTFVPAPLRISGGPEGSPSHESQPEHHPAPDGRQQPGPGRDPGGGRTLDVRATPELQLALRRGAP